MTGKTEVTFKGMTLRKTDKVNGKAIQVSVLKRKCEQVLGAGFASFPVGKLQIPGVASARVLFTSIPEEPAARVQFHKMLINACLISVRSWADTLYKQEQKTEKKRQASSMEAELGEAKEGLG